MNKQTNNQIDKPYIKFHFNQPINKFPIPVIPLEKYYKDIGERERNGSMNVSRSKAAID